MASQRELGGLRRLKRSCICAVVREACRAVREACRAVREVCGAVREVCGAVRGRVCSMHMALGNSKG